MLMMVLKFWQSLSYTSGKTSHMYAGQLAKRLKRGSRGIFWDMNLITTL
jgi:hypothetical protein